MYYSRFAICNMLCIFCNVHDGTSDNLSLVIGIVCSLLPATCHLTIFKYYLLFTPSCLSLQTTPIPVTVILRIVVFLTAASIISIIAPAMNNVLIVGVRMFGRR